MTLSVF